MDIQSPGWSDFLVQKARRLTIITIIYHLLINQELYQDNKCTTDTSKPVKRDLLYLSKDERLKDGVAAIVDAFYHLKNRHSVGGG